MKRLKQRTKIVLSIGILIFLILVVTFLNRIQSGGMGLVEKLELSTHPVETLRLSPTNLNETFHYSGVIRAENDVWITSEVSGRVLTISKSLGDPCKKGESVASLDREPYQTALNDAKGAFEQARIQSEQSQRDAKRMQRLAKQSAITLQRLEQAEAIYATQAAALTRAQAGLDLARRRLNESALACPFDGVIAERNVELGQMITPGMPVARVVDTTGLMLKLGVSGKELQHIKKGAPVKLVDATDPEVQFAGAVTHVGVAANQMSQTFPFEIAIHPGERMARPGQIVHAHVTVKEHTNVSAIPIQALQEDAQGTYIWVVQHSKAERLSVTPNNTATIEDQVVLETLLEQGTEVVLVGGHGLKTGDAVDVVASRDQNPSSEPSNPHASESTRLD